MPLIREDSQLYEHIKVSSIDGKPLTVAGLANQFVLNSVAGFEIPNHTSISLTYNSDDQITAITYASGVNTVASLTMTYSGHRLASIDKA